MKKSVCLLIASFVLTLAPLTASGQGHGANFAAQERAAAPALAFKLTEALNSRR